MSSKYITDLSARGDLVHRDVFFRKLYSVGAQAASTDAYVDHNNSKTKVTEVKSTVTSGNGLWSLFLRNSTSNAMEGNSRVSITPAETILSSDVTRIKGAMSVSNYASFEKDVDVTTGNMTVGKTLTVDGGGVFGNDVAVTKGNVITSVTQNAINFDQQWRIVHDVAVNGLAFEENTGTSGSPVWTRRFQFTA